MPSGHLPPPILWHLPPPFLWHLPPPFFGQLPPGHLPPPKIISFILEGVVDKEVTKVVEEVNKELVLDKEADMEVNQEVDREVANVVRRVWRSILEKGLLHVNYVVKRFLLETTWRCTWNLTLGKGLISGESADKCRCCAKVFFMSEEFEGPCGHYLLKKGLLHMNYLLKRFLVATTWRCTWKSTLSEGLPNVDIE